MKEIDPVPPMALVNSTDEGLPADGSDAHDHDHDHDTAYQDEADCDTGSMAAILPCGHMICHNCTTKRLYTAENHLAGRTDSEHQLVDIISCCPICRAVPRGQYAGCSHPVNYHVPTRAMDVTGWIQRVPRTTSEGGSIPTFASTARNSRITSRLSVPTTATPTPTRMTMTTQPPTLAAIPHGTICPMMATNTTKTTSSLLTAPTLFTTSTHQLD